MIAVIPTRRIVTVDDERGCSKALHDGPVEAVLHDPARPGYQSARVWTTDRAPAGYGSVGEVDRLPGMLVPPQGGSLFRILTIPPTAAGAKSIDASAARAFFESAGAPQLWCGDDAPDAYMEHGSTLDLCVVLDGEVILVLDTALVRLRAGDTVVQQATRHAWRNPTDHAAVIAISSHAADTRK